MINKDLEKKRARRKEIKRQYFERKKIAKYGADAVGKDMRGKHGNHARGSNNGKWNAERLLTSHGYVLVRVPWNHHLRMGYGYAYEHQIVAEKKLGRRLRDGEIVHHINGRHDDNKPSNLEVMIKNEHAREHVEWPGARDKFGRFSSAPRH